MKERSDPFGSKSIPGKRGPKFVFLVLLSIFVPVVVLVVFLEGALSFFGKPALTTQIGWLALSETDPAEQNEYGMRGHRASDGDSSPTFILLGDSQAGGAAQNFQDMPEVRLQDNLQSKFREKVRVLTVAAGGWGQDQELLALKSVMDSTRPRAVVLWFTPINDYWNNTFPSHIGRNGGPKPTYWLEGDELKGPNLPWLSLFGRRPNASRLRTMWDRAKGVPIFPSDEEWESKLPAAYSFREKRSGKTVVPLETYLKGQRKGAREISYFGQENFFTEKSHYSIFLTPPSSRMEYSLRLTRHLISAIQRECEKNGARFLIVYVRPWEFHEIPTASTEFEVGGKVGTLSTAAAETYIARTLEGFPVLEMKGFAADYRHTATDVQHLNSESVKLAMRQVADALTASPSKEKKSLHEE
jgi:hypothetical protein